MKNKTIIIFIFIFFGVFISKAQSGYLGSKNSINFEISCAKIFNNQKKRVDKATLEGVSKVTYESPSLKLNFSSTISRVINDNYRIDLGLSFSKLNLFTPYFIDSVFLNNNFIKTNKFVVLNTIPFRYYSGSVGFIKFYAGHSPVGKFWGINLSYGQAKTDKSIPLKVGLLYGKQINNNKYMYDVLYYRERILNYQGGIEVLTLSFNFGSTMPLTSKLGLDWSIKTSPIQLYHINNIYYTNYAFNKANIIDYNSSLGLNKQIALTIRNSNWFQIRFGLRYFI